MSSRRSGLFWSGLLLGAAVGTVAGILGAPRSGRETRQQLKKAADTLPDLAEELSNHLQSQADQWSIQALRQWDDTLEQLREALEAGMEAANAQRQAIQSETEQRKTP